MSSAKGGTARATWIAWPVDLDRHPAIEAFRQFCEVETAEAYFLRALNFAKSYARHGCMRPMSGENHWGALGAFVRWRVKGVDIEDAFVGAGLVIGKCQELLYWDTYNGWLIRRSDDEAARARKNRAAAARAASAKRAKRRAKKVPF